MASTTPRRFTATHPCPICGGYDTLPRGQTRRCGGYLGSDGEYAHCSRPELAPGLREENGGTYAHRLHGACRCGQIHGEAPRMEPSASRNGHHPEAGGSLDACYRYCNAEGALAFEVLRYRLPNNSKTFKQRHRSDNGAWDYTCPKELRVLYHLPELVAADPAAPVVIVEGEKDVDALAAIGVVATTNPLGAGPGKWLPRFSEVLSDRWCVLIPDNDDPGRIHMQAIAAALRGKAAGIQLLTLPGVPDKGDISDWLGDGKTLDDLQALIEAAPVLWTGQPSAPGCSPSPSASGPLSGTEILGPSIASKRWPDPPEALVYHGLAGEFVRLIDPHTEADPMALLVQFLVAYGNVIGRSAYFVAEADRHYTNLYACLIGETAKGRKGSSLGQVKRVMAAVAPRWVDERIQEGQSSGEGLIWAVRDPITKHVPVLEKGRPTGEYRDETTDDGISDKRLLAAESEFASLLRVLEREGNTLSAVLRQAWDSGTLRALTKNSQAKATGAHISEIGHITADELHRYLLRTEVANGLGNRYLWICVRRSKVLPSGGHIESVDFGALCRELNQALLFGAAMTEMARDDAAEALWVEVYEALSEGKPGMTGSLLARAEAQVMRLAMVYALLDLSPVIGLVHLDAALAVWRYCEASVRAVFGETIGDPIADTILTALGDAPEGLSRTLISKLFARHRDQEQLTRALAVLQGRGLIESEYEQTSGRPIEIIRLVDHA